jgi:hypothetical protein
MLPPSGNYLVLIIVQLVTSIVLERDRTGGLFLPAAAAVASVTNGYVLSDKALHGLLIMYTPIR